MKRLQYEKIQHKNNTIDYGKQQDNKLEAKKDTKMHISKIVDLRSDEPPQDLEQSHTKSTNDRWQ